MSNKITLDKRINEDELTKMMFNHQHWESNADRFDNDHTVSWGDSNMMNLEINNILKFINDGDLILDAGCSNGFSTFEIAKAKDVRIKAFDYSNKAINIACNEQEKRGFEQKISFCHGNILDIKQDNNVFDKAYTIRVVINLLSWELQQQGILEMYRVLKPGGLYLFSEAFTGSLANINQLRALANLSPLKIHKFNKYIEEPLFEEFVSQYFNIVDIKYFSSIYYVASRFLRYLTMDKSDQDSFIHPINNFFAEMEETNQSGDFGVQKLYVLKKKY